MSVSARLLRALLLLPLMAVLAVGALWALAHGEAFSGWLVRQLPGVTVTQARGALLGDFSADRIDVALPRGGRLWLVAPRWQGLRLVLDPSARVGLGVRADAVSAQRLDLSWVSDPASPPATAPDSLRLPLSVGIPTVRVGEARSDLWGAPLQQLQLSLQLRDDVHQVQLQSLHWSGWRLGPQGASLRLGTSAPLAVQLSAVAVAQPEPTSEPMSEPMSERAAGQAAVGADRGGAVPVAALPGELHLQAQGSVSDLRVQGQARWAASGGEQPQLDLEARLQPFAAWPLAQARVAARALDLSALQPGQDGLDQAGAPQAWPRTRLDGTLTLAPQGARGLALDIDLRNAGATAWGQGGVPLLGMKGRFLAPEGQRVAQGAPVKAPAGSDSDAAWTAALQRASADLRLTLPTLAGRAPATVTLQGEWGAREVVRLTLDGVQPQALHVAAPPLLLQGELRLRPQWDAASTSTSTSTSTSPAPSGQATPASPGLQRVQIDAHLDGTLGPEHAQRAQAASWPAIRQPVALDLDGEWRPQLWSVRTLRLRTGQASDAKPGSEASLRDARLRWLGPNAWQAQGELAVARFDPQVWLPWPQGMDRRNSLSAQGRFDIDQRGHGQADLSLLPSTLAGLPLRGALHWRASEAAALQLQADLDVAGNQVQAQGQGTAQQPLNGAWQVQVAAGQLQALSPLAPLLGLRQLQGAVQADARWQGGWPPRDSHGTLNARELRLTRSDGTAVSLASAVGDWHWGGAGAGAGGTLASMPLHLQATLQGLRTGGLQIDQAQATLSGSLSAHQFRLAGDGRVLSSPGVASGGGSGMPGHLVLSLDGGWQGGQPGGQPALGETSVWRGRLQQASVTASASSSTPTPTPTPTPSTLPAGVPQWFQVQPTDITWQQGPGVHRLVVQPTRVQLMGAELTVERLRWQGSAPVATSAATSATTPSNDTQLDLLLRLAPLNLPQWLARWQPQAGWGGDLTVGGQLRALRQPGRPWEIDAELARQAGDVTLSEPTVEGQTAQRLGLREARASLSVRNGLWTLQQTLDGRVLGRLSGRQTVQAHDPMALPQAGAALSGEVDMQVASLRPLATWAPAGWRLNGQLQARAQIGGTLGVPRWSGWVQGEQLAISQSLLGVHLSEGQLRIDLDGERARLTRFVASGGPQGGRVLADGEATLGASPQLKLHVQAERFAALQRIDRRIVLSGDTQATVSADSLQVRGRVQIDEGLIDIGHASAPTLGDDVTVRRRPGTPPDDGDAASSDGGSGTNNASSKANSNVQRKVDADIALDLGQQLRLKGHGLDGLLVGQLQVSTPSNKPSIKGVVKLSQGTFAAYGQKLRIERSTITFTGLIDNPRLDILAMRPQLPTADESDVRVGVRITGTALDPRIRLYSEPSLSETEQLSWLVLGRAPTGLGGADIGLLQSAAVALLSGDSREGLTDKVIGLLGLDNLSVRQSEGTVRDTVVNVGKQVSRHWYVGYERNLNATGGNWQLIYALAQRFKLRAQAGADNAVDLIWQWRWD
ncbi:translocation and assembly module TamB [Aquabacterium commune]|uniref:Translocation and assembly module TamB n=2 Tax=Aquabacterium commune TaxID=70586 RepID=A0A4R6RES3_9BURK|nr:translocation/assembly module TamB domain-containing protein [Aquabacterium commune]TDP84831.1 translocation and assembly module TamB [Aquabacterium commune]